MTFWDEHAKAEDDHAKATAPPTSQNAPTKCAYCGHVGEDVMLAVCARCQPSVAAGLY